MSKKKYPTRGQVLNHPAVTIASYFVFQGMRYMTLGEKIYKISITLLFATILASVNINIFVAIFFAHALNFGLNGQIPVLMRYAMSDIGLTRFKVQLALDKMLVTAQNFKIIDILIFGSFSRHCIKTTSDLDIRFYHRPGVFNGFLAYIYATYVRIWANINFIPIDVYCFSQSEFLDSLRSDENPALLFFSDEMCRKYPAAQHVDVALRQNVALP